MEIWQAIIVGIVQGLAEFLPISSSGHIVLTQFLLGIREQGGEHIEDVAFEVILHVGTLVSVLIYFRAQLWRMTQSLLTFRDESLRDDRMRIMWLGIATVPAVIAALLFGDWFKAAYNNPVMVSSLLLVTGTVLFAPRVLKGRERKEGLGSSLIMGIGQACAILPGISRSGSTIAAGLVSGVKPERAAEFSFLMSIPAIAGGLVMALKDRTKEYAAEGMETKDAFIEACLSCVNPAYMAGAVTSAVVGLFAIYVVLQAVKRGRLEYFSYYCYAAGISGIIYFSMNA
ncbi:undecaprenyl-diphosphate phosphatase [Persicirhabdus sediminis]|uniref:Undecaprenyl-diphosphatase n=1 Tax=Persicirhabdus sediminis TaxID=454144 RepID=A0A8J7SG56_9BACT|nr:undecaprenyl-diphosphate phosphatase [Persicirhabdus sediminis]MBK1789900.1 undecaprenyl-diphosphate phosphatase [Persicirhabdus sediminis]